MQQPILTKTEYDLVDIEDQYLSLMDESGSIRQDIKLPDNDAGEELEKRFESDEELSVTLLSWGDIEEAIIDFKKLN